MYEYVYECVAPGVAENRPEGKRFLIRASPWLMPLPGGSKYQFKINLLNGFIAPNPDLHKKIAFCHDTVTVIWYSGVMADVFALMNQGALGATGAGNGDAKASSLPLLAVILPAFKDSTRGIFAGLESEGIAGKSADVFSLFRKTKAGDIILSGGPKGSDIEVSWTSRVSGGSQAESGPSLG